MVPAHLRWLAPTLPLCDSSLRDIAHTTARLGGIDLPRPGGVAFRGVMVIALGSVVATLGLVVVFFVVFPALAHGLIAFTIAQVLGEREENRELESGGQQPSRG